MTLKGGLVVAVLVLVRTGNLQAQIRPADLQQFCKTGIYKEKLVLRFRGAVQDFYQLYNYNTAWVNNKLRQQQLFNFIKNSADLGLREEDYQVNFFKAILGNMKILATKNDSLEAEIRFTDAAIHFFTEVSFGNQPPDLGYNGLNYSPSCLNISAMLAEAISANRFKDFLEKIEPQSPEYINVKSKIVQYNRALRDTSFSETSLIKSNVVSISNRPLMQKLYQLNLVDSAGKQFSDAEIKTRIKAAQHLFSLLEDGALRETVIKELNVALSTRTAELSIALNNLRWLRCIRMQWPHIIVVNIPSANLLVYHDAEVSMESKVIVGKRSTRTPTLASKVTGVVLYPYWVVPKKIATRELLPLIKRDLSYLDANNLQVLNDQGKATDPAGIDWASLSASNFPYTLRQSTGCDNSLGLVKLDFYSPYGVYLHDTPWKILFKFNRRYFSHGCMRVDKAVELARLALKENTIAIDTLEEKGCLRNQKPIVVTASEQLPVFVLYNTAWVDSSGTVRFYEDIYNKRVLPKK